MGKPEEAVESHLRKLCLKNGILCWKFISPSLNGVPDRILICPSGEIIFVETKAPGETPRPDQLNVHRMLREHNCRVEVPDTKEECELLVNELIKTSCKQRKRKRP